MKVAGVEFGERGVDQAVVHAADEFGLLFGQGMKGAVAQFDGAVFVLVGLEALLGKHFDGGSVGALSGLSSAHALLHVAAQATPGFFGDGIDRDLHRDAI
ncbi:MAG: hypothetical protein IPI82_02855 [Candidatus Microthrix sp.]|nr:hypothetical protein [Candidatus Microthrix sp.]MBK7321413.1 hypothetical protein [Candidatus Microthrix sp.]